MEWKDQYWDECYLWVVRDVIGAQVVEWGLWAVSAMEERRGLFYTAGGRVVGGGG
jgi:hypothetical protein